jgi:hypothetical protein
MQQLINFGATDLYLQETKIKSSKVPVCIAAKDAFGKGMYSSWVATPLYPP